MGVLRVATAGDGRGHSAWAGVRGRRGPRAGASRGLLRVGIVRGGPTGGRPLAAQRPAQPHEGHDLP